MVDRQIGRFRIDALLGRGGMASVWRAKDELLGRTVALKLLANELAASASARRRFRHEAEIAMGLDHPAIAPVYAHGETDGVAWLAMRLIEGETLGACISRALLAMDEALRIACVIGKALGYAHAHDVIHRDVTSNNVMVSSEGNVYVLDFGIARAFGLSRITSTGVMLGTPGYLAPEILAGAPADACSDIYGLGVVLYEMLTGTLPFAGGRVESLNYRAMTEDPEPPSRRRAGLPAALDALVLRCTARESAKRFRDIDSLLAALEPIRTIARESMHFPEHTAVHEPPTHAHSTERAIYLAVGAISFDRESLASLARGVGGALRARVPRANRIHVVQALPPDDASGWREFGRSAGVNSILIGRLRELGLRVRLELSLVDAESGTLLAGGHVDGLSFESFALEDAAVARVVAMLGLADDPAAADSRPMRLDPAAEDHFARALHYLQRHDHEASVDGAIALLERLAASSEPRAEWLAALARACLMKYDLTRQRAWEGRATELCLRARAVSPDSPDVLLAWADLMTVSGRETEALEGYERVVRARPSNLEAWLGLAILHGQVGRIEQAEAAARRVIELSPRDWRGYNALGRAWIRFGRFEDATCPLRRAAELSPDNARVRRNLAVALAQSDRLSEAADLLREVVALEASDSAYANLGAALFALGDRAAALDAFERATHLAPADPQRWGSLGSALKFEPGRERQAAEAFDRAIGLMQDQLARNPGEPEWWARLADWLQSRGRTAEADAALARALTIGPENVACMLNAAFVMHQRGDRSATLEWLRRAVAHGHGRLVLSRSAEFGDLRDDPEFRSLLEPSPIHRESESTAHGRAHREECT